MSDGEDPFPDLGLDAEEQKPEPTAEDLAARDEERGFDEEQLATCLHVLNCFKTRMELLNRPEYRELRGSGLIFVEGVDNAFFERMSYDKKAKQRYLRAERKRRELKRKAADRKNIDRTTIRAERLERLQALLATPGVAQIEGAATAAAATSTSASASAELSDKPHLEDFVDEEEDEDTLNKARSCYICKVRFFELHSFYDQLCPACADVSWRWRNIKTDLTGYVAVVTGARVKIGFKIALRLLECGATVIATTRFPVDATARFAKEPNSADFKDRLFVYGADFRDLIMVEALCATIAQRFEYIDILINNAAQTQHKPPHYYRHLLEAEQTPRDKLPALQAAFVAETVASSLLTGPAQKSLEGGATGTGAGPVAAAAGGAAQPAPGTVGNAAMMSQIATISEDLDPDMERMFPEAMVDADNDVQQLDLRERNSWNLKLGEVETPEVVEVMAINAIAPFVLCNRLLPLLRRSPHKDKFVVCVSAMEGRFYRIKMPTHPHTNMAKSGLNQLVRTSAQSLKEERIWMTAVDTGWINDENGLSTRIATHINNKGFVPPLDEAEAMSRVLHPVFAGLVDGDFFYDCFMKDFKSSEW